MEADLSIIERLRRVMEENPCGFAAILRRKDMSDVLSYVERWCEFMDGNPKMSTKCWYAVNRLREYVRCGTCSRPITRDVASFTRPSLDYCGVGCLHRSDRMRQKVSAAQKSMSSDQQIRKTAARKRTCLERYGNENYRNDAGREKTLAARYGNGIVNPFQAEEVKKAAAAACLTRYGETSYAKTAERAEKSRRTCVARYGTEYAAQNASVKAKTASTNVARYGGSSPMCSAETQAKARATNLRKYGVEYAAQDTGVSGRRMASYEKTRTERYGGLYPQQTDKVRKKISDTVSSDECQNRTKATSLERYGTEYVCQNREIRLKSQARYHAAVFEKYGTAWPMQSSEVRRLAAGKYRYEEVRFDSAPELAYYIWLSDTGADFEYQPDCVFFYEYEGRKHRYFPDFKVNGRYQEIKGGHMLGEDGRWICPWDRSLDGLYEAKGKCAAEHGVQVLTEADYGKYMAYVKETYGGDYLKRFRQGERDDE